MPIIYCAHCKNLSIQQQNNETDCYSIKEDDYRGNPIIEILHNGGPIHDFDKNFRFGLVKAEMIMSCFSEVSEFAFLPKNHLKRKRTIRKNVGNIEIMIEYFPKFTNSYGKTINQPYINIYHSDIHIGIGQKKAEAIFYLKEEIIDWIKKHS